MSQRRARLYHIVTLPVFLAGLVHVRPRWFSRWLVGWGRHPAFPSEGTESETRRGGRGQARDRDRRVSVTGRGVLKQERLG